MMHWTEFVKRDRKKTIKVIYDKNGSSVNKQFR